MALFDKYTANVYSQTAVEVHWKTCFLSESTVLWLQFFYKYFTVLVVNNNCYYCRYFNAFSNAAKGKCKVQLITAIWNTGKLTQIVQGKAVHFTFKNTLFLLRRETILLATIIGRIDNFMIVIWWQGEKLAGWEICSKGFLKGQLVSEQNYRFYLQFQLQKICSNAIAK